MTGKARDSMLETAHLSDAELSQLQARRHAPDEVGDTSLLLYYRDGVRAVQLVAGRAQTIGRFPPADVCLPEPSLSRQHASVELVEGEVWIEDLQSTNGTWLNGERVERAPVHAGDDLVLGVVAASLHTRVAGDSGASAVLGHDALCLQLEAELERARCYRRGVALLMLRGRGPEAGRPGKWLHALRAHLRAFDTLALYSPDTVELLLPELDAGAATSLARKIIEGSQALCCGIAVYPQHATSADELLARARAALGNASDAGAVELASQHAAPSASSEASAPIAESASMRALFVTVGKVADAGIPVLIQGETGSGKEVVARAIHAASPRRAAPLVAMNCGAIPESLVESQLFGHEKGAFTGASQRRVGVFEAAAGGTVFLDEIGDLPLAAQAALLRVLEEKRLTRVGSTRELEVDVRVVAATHRDLEAMSADGHFRQDLLFRLNAVSLEVPPLRARPEEIEPLARRFLLSANQANARAVEGLEAGALDCLRGYSWPGNVRELRNAIDRAVVIAQESLVTIDDLPERVRRSAAPDPGGESPAHATPSGEAPRGAVQESAARARTADGPDAPINLRAELERYEAELILRALRDCDWDRRAAASALGLPLRTLSHKMQNHGIKRIAYSQRE